MSLEEHCFRCNLIITYFSSGIFEAADCGTNTNHDVQIIGYGTEAAGAYWIIKNSWGTWWGDGGYFKLERKPTTTIWWGACSVLYWAGYPVV